MTARTLLLSLVLLFPQLAYSADTLCALCETADTLPVRFDYNVGNGQSCLDIYLAASGLSPNSDNCKQHQNRYRRVCCDLADPPPVVAPPPTTPVYRGPVGDEPDCPVCYTDEYPGIPNAFIVARYVGDYSCAQLYDRGNNGLIPWFMCGPLQDFAIPVCGCGEYNPKCKSDPTKCYGYKAPQARSPTGPTPTTAEVPTLYDRKTRPNYSKYSNKLGRSSGRGGSAAQLRGNRNLVKGKKQAKTKPSQPLLVVEDHATEEVISN